MFIGLLLAGTAHAHSPHDVVTALAVSETFSGDGTAWLVLDPHDVSQLLVTHDHGKHWDFLGGAPQEDTLVGLAVTGDHLLAAAKDGTTWSSQDGGLSWAATELPGSPVVHAIDAAGGTVAIATGAGLQAGPVTDLGALALDEPDDAFVDVAIDPADPTLMVALRDDGAVFRSTDGGLDFVRAKGTPRPVRAVAVHGTTAWAGTDAGVLFQAGGETADWLFCADLPRTSKGDEADTVPILRVMPDGTLLAATGVEAIFVSTDGCASWTYLDTGVRVAYGSIGFATDVQEGWTGLYYGDGRVLAAGFYGLQWSDDAGATFHGATLIPADYFRGLAVAPDWPADSRLFFAGYGGGPWWTADGGRTWAGSAVGVEGAFGYDIIPDTDVASSGRLFYAGSLTGHRSEDDGATWEVLDIPQDRVRVFEAAGGRVWALGENSTGGIAGQVSVSDDHGATWTLVQPLVDLMGAAAPNGLFEADLWGQDTLLVTTDNPSGVAVSTDGGASWSWLKQAAVESGTNAAAWPPGKATRLIFTSRSGGVELSDDGVTWRAPQVPPEGMPRELVMADDGTLVLATAGSRIYLSHDGGENWTDTGVNLPSAVHELVAVPGFADDPIVLAGTYSGAWWSGDGGSTWQVLPRYQRFEQDTDHLLCTAPSTGDPCALLADDAMGYGGAWLMVPSDVLSFSLQGDRFAIHGVPAGAGEAVLYVDGSPVSSWKPDGEPLTWTLPDDGWHDVSLEVTRTEADFTVDFVEIWGPGTPLPGFEQDTGEPGGDTGGEDTGALPADSGGDTGEPPATGSGCGGCGGTGTPGGGMAALLGLLLLRRRRSLPCP